MSKSIVTRLFIGGVVAVTAGAILAVAAVLLALANDVFVIVGSDIVDVRASGLAWSLLGLGIVGGVTILGGLAAGFVSWIGAMLNTWQLESRTWFAVLLLLGIFNLGFVAMIAYLIAGPDSATAPALRRTNAPIGA